jgi:hypothetical protein
LIVTQLVTWGQKRNCWMHVFLFDHENRRVLLPLSVQDNAICVNSVCLGDFIFELYSHTEMNYSSISSVIPNLFPLAYPLAAYFHKLYPSY